MNEASEITLPDGAVYMPAFVNGEEAIQLVFALDAVSWDTTMKRRVQHFGYRYDYRARAVTGDAYLGPLPGWLDDVCGRLVRKGHFKTLPDQS